uniref:cyclin-A2-1 n=1 Tax=Erigeron canadensis TaxID=72917 RepID=UPI001CB8DC12|nr:cyclin-A2-1 [Erigeron canadensis]
MKKGTTAAQPPFRVTRARAAACQSSLGSELPKELVQTRAMNNNHKRSVQDENNNNASVMGGAQNKRRAVLKDVSNICCDNSFKNCIVPTKIPKKTSMLAKRNAVNISKVKTQPVSSQNKNATVEHVMDLENTKRPQKAPERERYLNTGQIDTRVVSQLQSFSKKGKSKIHEKLMSASKPDVIDIDSDQKDPQICSLYAGEIYSNLRVAELMHRPHFNFMETIQRDVTQSMRGVLVDWLVEVSVEYKLELDTLYLTVYLIDLFLSQHYIERQRLQLLGITCMLIASKYEELCAPALEEFCFITDNTYTKSEVVTMESEVLNNLNFQLAAPTTLTFLRRFIRAANASHQILGLEFEFLANYLAELTLIDYNFLVFLPSTIAASVVFLATWMLDQSHHPWNDTLEHYTSYKAMDLKNTVLALHGLHLNDSSSPLTVIRSKYKQEKFKCVASLPSRELPESYFNKPQGISC